MLSALDAPPGRRVPFRRLTMLGVGLLLGVTGVRCSDGTAGPGAGGTLTVLFIGNSLTATNDLPALVRQIAQAAGATLTYDVVAPGGVSLEDHWNDGITDRIAQVGADVVVLQQGPSSLPENQEHLKTWATMLAGPIRAAGGVPALLMVWPESTRQSAFDAVRTSYRAAAEHAGGLFIPAGEVWRETWRRDPDVALYGTDGFHPSLAGSFAAALTVYAVLFDPDLSELPSDFSGLVPAGLQALLRAVVRDVVAAQAIVAVP